MAYPNTDWPGATDAILTRVNLIDLVDADDFNYQDKQIRSLQDWIGDGQGEFIGDSGTAADGAGGITSPIADGGIALTIAAKKDFTSGKLISIGDNYDAAYSEKAYIDYDGNAVFAGLQLGATVAVTSILDEDNMASDSAVALATQQSIKAYVDAVGDYWDRSGGVLYPSTSGDMVSVRDTSPIAKHELFVTAIHGDNVDICQYTLKGSDDAGNPVEYAQIIARAVKDDAGSEEGALRFLTANGAGALAKTLEIESNGTLNVSAVTNYETLVTNDDDIPNKKYVDDLFASGLSNTYSFGGGGSGDIATMTFTNGLLTGVTTVP